MHDMTERNEAALWQCEICGVWWCSQPVVKPTRFLLDLPRTTLEALGWDNYRGWSLGGTPHVSTCPECGAHQTAPVYGTAPAGSRLRIDLAELMRPALAPAG